MGIILHRLFKIKTMLEDTAIYLINYRVLKILAENSLAYRFQPAAQDGKICPLCKERPTELLINFPLGWPIRQNDQLLYYDYTQLDFNAVKKRKELLVRGGGFFLSVKWNFCRSCQNASLNTNFTDEHLKEYYSNYYERIALSGQKRRNTKEAYARYVDSFIGKNSNLLEFGSAEGYAAAYLARQGHKVCIVEPSAFGRIAAENAGVDLVSDINGLNNNFFDGIYLHHVFEHLCDPVSFLTKAHKLLKKWGILIIQVPDISLQFGLYLKSLHLCHYTIFNPVSYNKEIYSLYLAQSKNTYYWMDALGNNHLYAFSPYGLEYILKQNNFKIKTVKQTRREELIFDKGLSWPVDRENGQTPNGLTIVAEK